MSISRDVGCHDVLITFVWNRRTARNSPAPISQIHTVLGDSSRRLARRPEEESNEMDDEPTLASDLSLAARPCGDRAWVALVNVWIVVPVSDVLACSCQI